VQFTGTTLHIADPLESDSCTITIMASPDVAAANHTYYLIGQARGKAWYGASFNFSKEGVKKLQVSKSTFPTGIVRFTLSEPDSTALNERIIYIDHQDKLDIQSKADKKIYKTRDSVSLILNVSDEGGNPVQGSFSLAVT